MRKDPLDPEHTRDIDFEDGHVTTEASLELVVIASLLALLVIMGTPLSGKLLDHESAPAPKLIRES